MNKWNTGNIGDLNGKRIVITGSSHGIGFEAARVLVSKGAEVVLAVRNREKGEKAAAEIRAMNGSQSVAVMDLDLADLESVKRFAEGFISRYDKLDVLINNAGVMITPYRRTKDGFELQFGTNHLGHFALTGQLLPVLINTPSSRIVSISSIAARKAKIHFDSLDASKGYSSMKF